jgi:Bacterial HORMA domain 2
MSTAVIVNTYAFSATYVTDNILRALEDIVRESGLDPSKITDERVVLTRGIKAWIDSKHLETIVLEVSNPGLTELVGRWDINVTYGWDGEDGRFWVDTNQIKAAIRKAGVWPGTCEYRVVCTTKPGRPDVAGWGTTTLLSTVGFVRQSLGTTITHGGLGASASYYRKAN